MLECAELGDFILGIYEDAHSVGLKTWVNIKVLSPVEHTLEVPLFDEMRLDVNGLQDDRVISKILYLIFELFVLFDTVRNIDV